MDQKYKETPMIKFLKNEEKHFRIFPADESQLRSNYFSYWNIESIGGYRPIKLRNYQDLMDARGFYNPKVLDMLNVKYVLTKRKIENSSFSKIENIPGLFHNNNALPRAWLVGSIKSVDSQRESLMEVLLSTFDPKKQAVVVDYTGPDLPQFINGDVSIDVITENKIELSSLSKTAGLLVLSEIYYKPGWKAKVNGVEVPIYQTNHVLRSVHVPAGTSKVVFEYDTTSWKRTRILSRLSFFFILIVLGGIFWKQRD